MTERSQTVRLVVACILLTAAFTGLGYRLALLHLGPNEDLLKRVATIRRVEQPLQTSRGRIFDRNGQLLAMDLTVYDVCVDPVSIQQEGYQDFIASHLARLLQIEPAAVLQRVNRPDRRFEYIRRRVPHDMIEPIRAMQFPSRMVWFEPISMRHYPQGILGCHIIGFTNLDGIGSSGLEQTLEQRLRGRPGVRVSERDGRGRELPDRRSLEIRSHPGSDVTLTIDARLQKVMETELERAMAMTQSKAAWAILQRVRTGEILAMASRPAFDLNAFRTSSEEDRRNRNLATVYEPGSTFKVAVLAAVFNEGVTTPDEIVDCERGMWMHRNRPLRDFSPHGLLSVQDVLKFSSNIGTAKLALRLREETLDDYLRAFGFGRVTGIDLPGEQGGIFRRPGSWSSLSQSRIAIGHEIGATALQVLNSLCAVANDGALMKPTIIRHVTDPNGNRSQEFAPIVLGRPIREDTARLLLPLLVRVTEPRGTGARGAVDGYRVAGKTGTTQKLVDGRYSDHLTIASFAGVLPAHDPEIGLIVVLDEPRGARTGGAAAAPVFRAIAEKAVRILDIPPDQPTPAPGTFSQSIRHLEIRHDPGTPL